MLKDCIDNSRIECGIDESGAGPLAGPVVAAAVVWPTNVDFDEEDHLFLERINDSKKVSPKWRAHLAPWIKDKCFDYQIAFISPQRVDEINILNARIEAMHHAISGLKIVPDHLLIDGTQFKPYFSNTLNSSIPHQCIPKGDGIYQSIAAASILAKYERDLYMEKLDKQFPQYGWIRNKGYGTKEHREKIKEYGLSEHHRQTFCLKILKKMKVD